MELQFVQMPPPPFSSLMAQFAHASPLHASHAIRHRSHERPEQEKQLRVNTVVNETTHETHPAAAAAEAVVLDLSLKLSILVKAFSVAVTATASLMSFHFVIGVTSQFALWFFLRGPESSIHWHGRFILHNGIEIKARSKERKAKKGDQLVL
jgi:hypothetical protein